MFKTRVFENCGSILHAELHCHKGLNTKAWKRHVAMQSDIKKKKLFALCGIKNWVIYFFNSTDAKLKKKMI